MIQIAPSAFEDTLGIVEKADTAANIIHEGQFVVWKGHLYIASSNIAVGDTLSLSNLDTVSTGGFNNFVKGSSEAIIQNGDTASRNISANEYVLYKGLLYKTITAITAGETFTGNNLRSVDSNAGYMNTVGSYISGTSTGSSVATGTETTVATIKIEGGGRWLLFGGFCFSSNDMDGKNQAGWIRYSTSETGAANRGSVVLGTVIRNKAYGSGGINTCGMINISSSSPYYILLSAFQTSGSTQTVSLLSLTAVRVR